MKLKKLLTVLGCFALVLMCAFTFVGCGEVDSSAEEVNAFLANESVESNFARGISIDMSVSGKVNGKTISVKLNGQIDENIHGKLYINSNTPDGVINTTAYTDGSYVYFENYGGETKVKYSLMAVQSEGSEDYGIGELIGQIYEAMTSGIDDFAQAINGAEVSGAKIQKKGDVEKGNVSFIVSVDAGNFGSSKMSIRFDNFKIAEYYGEGSLKMDLGSYGSMNLSTYVKFGTYTGSVSLPNNLNEYTINGGISK